jgi:hypothetical protein
MLPTNMETMQNPDFLYGKFDEPEFHTGEN